ncbi:MAG: hypothetical protein ACRDVO_03900 [Jiangellaceae bacterium]
MAAPTVVTPDEDGRTQVEPAAIGSAATWWYDWVDQHRVAASALVGVIATQLGTYFGYVFPAIGLPTLPWPLYNGILAVPAEEFGTTGSFFAGNSLHFVNGIVFAILYAVLALPIMPFRNTHGGNVARGLLYSVVLTVISLGVLVPYAYVPEQGYGLFAFSGPDGWKLPAAVLLWHLIYGFFLGTLFQLRRANTS